MGSDNPTFQQTCNSSSEDLVKHFIDIVKSKVLIPGVDLEEVWKSLLEAFLKFDPQRSLAVTPRDFCLVISGIMDGQGPVLTKHEWEYIIAYFRADVNPRHPNMVNYQLFVNEVVERTPQAEKHKFMTNFREIIHVDDKSDVARIKTKTSLVPSKKSLSPERRKVKITPKTTASPPHSRAGSSNRISNSLVAEKNPSESHAYRRPRSAASSSPKTLLASVASTTGSRAYTPKGSNRGATSVVTTSGTKKFNVSYAPEQFSNEYYEENEECYNMCNTISGRGVVGSSFQDLPKRSLRTRVNVPRTQPTKVESSISNDKSIGSLFGNGMVSRGSVTSKSGSIGVPLTRSDFLSQFDPASVRALNAELGDLLSDRLSKTPGVSMRELLLQCLHEEDKNRSHTLKIHSVRAALLALGVQHHFLATPGQKELLDCLVKCGKHGEISVKDFMKLIVLP